MCNDNAINNDTSSSYAMLRVEERAHAYAHKVMQETETSRGARMQYALKVFICIPATL